MISPLCILSQWREKMAGTVAWLFEGLRAERVCWSSSLGDITNLTPPPPPRILTLSAKHCCRGSWARLHKCNNPNLCSQLIASGGKQSLASLGALSVRWIGSYPYAASDLEMVKLVGGGS